MKVFDEQSNLVLHKNHLGPLVDAFFKLMHVQPKDVHIYFVSKEEITRLHGHFFNDPTPTDCITFPIHTDGLLGEIFICPEVAIDYFPENPHKETTLYVVHALLHLLGFDDIQPEDRAVMREKEAFVMDYLEQHQLFV